MPIQVAPPYFGGCACGTIRYRLDATPMIINCCHCSWCQKESGSAFNVNVIIEASNVTLLPPTTRNDTSAFSTAATGKIQESGGTDAVVEPTIIESPSHSGDGHFIYRCPKCYFTLFSHFPGSGPAFRFVRTGTLDHEFAKMVKPDVHLFLASKMDWVELPDDGTKRFEGMYSVPECWSEESMKRREACAKAWGERKENEK